MISDKCKAQIIENGVVMKDGKPAGVEFMSKPVLKIALIDSKSVPDPEGQKQVLGIIGKSYDRLAEPLKGDNRLKYDYSKVLDNKERNLGGLQNFGTFPDDIEEVLKAAIGYWYDGDIEFVGQDDNPDFRVFAFSIPNDPMGYRSSGFSSFPPNDHPAAKLYGIDVPMMALATHDDRDMTVTDSKAFLETARHEFGHSLGVLHPYDATRFMGFGEDEICNGSDAGYMWENPGYMGLQGDDNQESVYDKGARDFIRGTLPDNLKP